MKRVAATFTALLLVLVGCRSPVASGAVIVTGTPANTTLMMGRNDHGGCTWEQAKGLLLADPNYGTAMNMTEGWFRPDPTPIPVLWPPGFTGRRSGSEVQVLDPQGKVVAVTGTTYIIDGGYLEDREPTQVPGSTLYWPGLGVSKAWWACGDVQTPAAVREKAIASFIKDFGGTHAEYLAIYAETDCATLEDQRSTAQTNKTEGFELAINQRKAELNCPQ